MILLNHLELRSGFFPGGILFDDHHVMFDASLQNLREALVAQVCRVNTSTADGTKGMEFHGD